MRNPRHDVLFNPVPIGPKVLRNRFYQVPHTTGFTNLRPFSEARHRAIKAEGGWAGVCVGSTAISHDSDEWPVAIARIWDDSDAAALKVMAEEVHEHGGLAGVELHHSGAHADRRETRAVGLAPSQLSSDMHHVVPKAMELRDIHRVQRDWAAAAVRARDVGFDIVYVYGAHSYLPMQFLSPFYNHRTDEYGGSFENRARFWLETLEAVRDAVGAECAIASRISVDALGPAGVQLDEALRFVTAADDLVDLWDVNVGSISSWNVDSGSSRFFREGHQLEWTRSVRAATSKPICGVGRFTNPDVMAEAVTSGALDVIGAARPSIADPFLPRKIEEGRLDDIRECTGNNQCIARGRGSPYALAIICTQNATAGEEYRRGWHPERFDRAMNADSDVLVVGAGPAGLECAMVLGKRGMRSVHLVEAAAEIGGAMRWTPRLPGLAEWSRVVSYRQVQLRKLTNVEVITDTPLSAPEVLDYGADIVVVATGSHWSTNGLNAFTHAPITGADASKAHCLTPEQIMVEEKPLPGDRIVVIDYDGDYVAASLAERLASEGCRVTIVTPFTTVAPITDGTLEGGLLRQRLNDVGVAMRTVTRVRAISADGVTVLHEFGAVDELESDAVVLVTQRVSDGELYLELAAAQERGESDGLRGIYRIGDCVAPRVLADVIFDGHRLGREIDSGDPAQPLPHIREAWLNPAIGNLVIPAVLEELRA